MKPLPFSIPVTWFLSMAPIGIYTLIIPIDWVRLKLTGSHSHYLHTSFISGMFLPQ